MLSCVVLRLRLALNASLVGGQVVNIGNEPVSLPAALDLPTVQTIPADNLPLSGSLVGVAFEVNLLPWFKHIVPPPGH